MNYAFLPDAFSEFEEAVSYYDQHGLGLGDEFTEEVYDTISRILHTPETWPQYFMTTRRCLMHRFPYGVIYQAREDHIIITAVAHCRREPFYWKERLV